MVDSNLVGYLIWGVYTLHAEKASYSILMLYRFLNVNNIGTDIYCQKHLNSGIHQNWKKKLGLLLFGTDYSSDIMQYRPVYNTSALYW